MFGLALNIPDTSVKFSYSDALTPRAMIAPVISEPPLGKVTINDVWKRQRIQE